MKTWGNKIEKSMHYRNGREAENRDKIVKLQDGKVVSFGVLAQIGLNKRPRGKIINSPEFPVNEA